MKEGNERRVRSVEKNFYNFFEDEKIDPPGVGVLWRRGGGSGANEVKFCEWCGRVDTPSTWPPYLYEGKSNSR